MGRTAVVVSTERVVDQGVHALEVKIDPGGGAIVTAEHFADVGSDSNPLPGDEVALESSSGAGSAQVSGYSDTRNAGTSQPGEKRIYARNAQGTVVAELWLKGNGDVDVRSIASGGKITLNGVEIDQQGNITAPGEVTAKSASPATAVKLSTHTHPTGVGPTSPPTAGT